MKRLLLLGWLATLAALPFSQAANAQNAEYNALVAAHAQANGVPEVLVHRVIVRESRYQPALVGRGGTIGLMQIKLATARGLGQLGACRFRTFGTAQVLHSGTDHQRNRHSAAH